MDELAPLVTESAAEGYRFLVRLMTEYAAGSLRFDGPGETMLGAREDGILLGVGGLTRDPYQPPGVTGVGRIRRVYVRHADRGRGIGARLIRALEAHAEGHFDSLVLRAASPDAARFYESLGYVTLPPGNEATHRRRLAPSQE